MSLDTVSPAARSDGPAQAPSDASLPVRASASMITTPPPEVSHPLLTRVWQGSADRARWERPALVCLLSVTAVLYLWGLGASGWANSFYSAAAQAGSESWKAWFFGASDAASSITVDKPPLAIWVMGLSVRIFGLSSWSILVPEALMGVASVGLLYAVVRRAARSAGAGLLAGAVLALTPVASLMFRFNNPDALLVLLLIGAAGATLRAIEVTWRSEPAQGRAWWTRATTWLAVAGLLLGLAFLTKMLQAFLIVPGLGIAYLVLARTTWLARVRDLGIGLLAIVVGGGWWVAIVSLWPADDRPYIGGSQHNSVLELIFGYNGFGRLDGSESGSVGGLGGWGSTGLLRMLNSEIGGQVGWLLPASLVLAVAAGWFALRSRAVGALAGLVVFGCWLVVTTLTFSLMAGIFHPYYTVALAPAIGAIIGIGGVVLWRHRASVVAAAAMAVVTAIAAATGFVLLDRTPTFLPWLRWLVLIVGLAAAVLLGGVRRLSRRAGALVATAAVLAALAGPAAYTLETVRTPHTGSIPSAGPTVAGSFGPGGGGVPGVFRGGFPRGRTGAPPTGMPGAGTGPFGGSNPLGGGGRAFNGGGGAAGGLLDGSTPSAALTRLLDADASSYTWVAATIGSNTASGYQLATLHSVMPIGGFNGSDPSPTLARFKAFVAAGRIHYFIGGGQGGGLAPGGNTASQITSWVESHFSSKTVGGVTLYDLSVGAR